MLYYTPIQSAKSNVPCSIILHKILIDWGEKCTTLYVYKIEVTPSLEIISVKGPNGRKIKPSTKLEKRNRSKKVTNIVFCCFEKLMLHS